ncbi:GIY-YIG nuclease family protein [Phyllobacterium sp. 628]|uniref:GIY-YIG nuclease family protein n=1 Tax=Phyllobacterium sp. 628 TaxID=2718938 RepID=UPI00166251FE|nr:GIY-YIG nuclease family protein [Phyllobacterium sp. 628]QND53273.1 GIY-YIG nuclease family protein [Phyllobacterium sp. 628]
MKHDERKAALAAYKERKTVGGIFAILCIPTGQRWVGRAPDLGTIQNRIWFTLRQGIHRQRSLQEAWNGYGEAAFSFTETERFDDDLPAYARDRISKDRIAHWCTELGAKAI